MSEVLGRPWLGASLEEEGNGDRRTPAAWVREQLEPQPYDRVLLTLVLVAMAFGVVMVYSASLVRAGVSLSALRTGQWEGNPEHYLIRSLLNVAAGLVAMLVALKVPLAWYRRHAYLILVVAVVLLFGVLFVGHTAKNSTRWYDLKVFRFQPTEMAKLALIIYLAFSIVKKAEKIKTFTVGLFPHLLVIGVLVVLCLKQPDLGTSAIMVAIMGAMLLVGGVKLRYLAWVLALAVTVGYFLVMSSDTRIDRMTIFLDPWQYCSDKGYHLCESLIGIASGGTFGAGLGNGKMKLFFLPEAHTDFVMAIVMEELGYLGLVFVVLLFTAIAWRGLRIALRATSPFGRYLAFGITLQLATQAAVNLGVITAVLPTKGLTLPFISYGGSSMVFSCYGVGLLLLISMHRPDLDEDRSSTWQRPPYGSGRLRRLVYRLQRAVG